MGSDVLKKKLSATKTIEKKGRASGGTPKALADVDHGADAGSPTGGDPDVQQVSDTTHEKEYDVVHPSGEKMRDKVRSLLTDALFVEEEAAPKTRDDALVVGVAIENAMFGKFEGNGQPYKSKFRELSFNLKDKKNVKLRAAVLSRAIPPSVLLELSSEELANDDLKKVREEMHEKMTREAMPYNKREATTDMFRCGKCKERKCTYYQMQTRSADEPLTTFVQCVNCENRWRF